MGLCPLRRGNRSAALRRITIADKIAELAVPVPEQDSFWRLGDLTALRQDAQGRFYRSNYGRGPLLYALVVRRRPAAILEFGTGRGYGALSMARALVEHGIDGQVFTIDLLPQDAKQTWWIDTGSRPQVLDLSRAEVWERHVDPAWVARVTCLTGHSFRIMERWKDRSLPAVDLAFVDGGHGYEIVKHDFYSLLGVAGTGFCALLDDYAERPGFGVRRLVDEEVAEAFEAELLTDQDGGVAAGGGWSGSGDAGMVLIASDRMRAPLAQVFPRDATSAWLARSRRRWRRQRVVGRVRGGVRSLARRLGIR